VLRAPSAATLGRAQEPSRGAEVKVGCILQFSRRNQEVTMTAIAHALSRALQSTGEFETLKLIALFCGVGLLLSLVCLTYGLDLSPGFF
jgi:hypothetical protein